MSKKKLFILFLSLFMVLSAAGCGGSGAYVFTPAWRDKHISFEREYAEYQAERFFYPDGENGTVIASGTFCQEITLNADEKQYLYKSDLTITYIDKLPAQIAEEIKAGAVDTITASLSFGSDTHTILKPYFMEKIMDYQSVDGLSRQVTAEYPRPTVSGIPAVSELTVTQTMGGETAKVIAKESKVKGMFDNESLFLVARCSPGFIQGSAVSIPLVSAVDTAIDGTLKTFSISVTVGETAYPWKAGEEPPKIFAEKFSPPFINDDGSITALGAVFANQNAPQGPPIEVIFAAYDAKDKDNKNSSVQNLILKITQTEYYLSGDFQYKPKFRTVYTITDFSTMKVPI